MPDAPDTIDGTAQEVTPGPGDRPGAALVRAPTREVLMPADAAQVVEGFRAYQQLMQDLLDPTDWQQTTETEPDPQHPGRTRRKRFPKKSAYRKISRAFSLSLHRVEHRVHFAPDGSPLYAEATYRAVAPNGQEQDGDGYCAITEFTGKRRNDPKLLNALAATATTRAKNRAISDLVGMGEVSAEEVSRGGDPDAGPGDAPDRWELDPLSDEQLGQLRRVVAYLLDPQGEDDPERIGPLVGQAVARIAGDTDGVVLRAGQRAVGHVAAVLREALTPDDDPPPPAPGQTYGDPPAERPGDDDPAAQAAFDALATPDPAGDDVGDPPASAQEALDTAGAPAPADSTPQED